MPPADSGSLPPARRTDAPGSGGAGQAAGEGSRLRQGAQKFPLARAERERWQHVGHSGAVGVLVGPVVSPAVV